MSDLGQKRTSEQVRIMSGIPLVADIRTAPRCSDGRNQRARVACNSHLTAAGTALVVQLDRVSQTFHKPPLVERLAQEVDRSVIDRTSPVFVVWVCGNQNHWHLISPGPQRFLQLKPALSRQFQVSDQACRLCDHTRLEEVLRRCESGGGIAKGFDKLAHAVAGQFVIINDRDQ